MNHRHCLPIAESTKEKSIKMPYRPQFNRMERKYKMVIRSRQKNKNKNRY